MLLILDNTHQCKNGCQLIIYLCANKSPPPLQNAKTVKEFSHKNVARQSNWHLHKRIIKVVIHAFPVSCC